ncbi:MAG: hypothetical protein CVT59_10655 [Actinobacteria bacterium HGW-Actinobacteria-1]|jgi:hypothetical protein|nr:MAG: hypothetical protein CVT59_10655 [Actinobacteria bacterium HGW-Actinobacteria-1]
MRSSGFALLTASLLLATPSIAFAQDGTSATAAISTGAGVVALVVAALLLLEMLALRKLAQGAAIADNITYAILGVACMTTSVLLGWIARYVPTGFTAEQARLGADLLSIVSMVLFGIYFFRVRRAMSRFLGRLTGQEQDLISVLEPVAELPADRDGDGV